MISRKRSAKVKELYSHLKGSPENRFYLSLLELLGNIEAENLDQMVKTSDTDELLRLQGGCRVLKNIYDNLTRKPVDVGELKPGAYR